jgi:hypothetical protein
MDFQNRAGNKAGGGGVAGWSVCYLCLIFLFYLINNIE